MIPLILSSLFLAGGASFLGNLQIPGEEKITNHTLLGEKIAAKNVVCRDRWGTPMPPDGKAGYSLIAPTNAALIAQSLWIPPVSGSRPDNAVSTVSSIPVAPEAKGAVIDGAADNSTTGKPVIK
jgi:hypothetical protein